MYDGFRILTHPKKFSNRSVAIDGLKEMFNNHEYYLSENAHRIVIFYEPTKQQINVSLKKAEYSSEWNGKVFTFNMVLESPFFGFGNYDERVHRELYEKTMQKVRWAKLGGYLEDGVFKPRPRHRMLRSK